jgi:hypothetical protein
MHKTLQCWTILEIRCRKVHNVVARSLFRNQIEKVPHVLIEKVHAVVAQSALRIKMLKPPRFGPLLEIRISLRFITYTILYSTALHLELQLYRHSTTLHYTLPSWITLQLTPPHCTTFHYTSLQETKTTLRYITTTTTLHHALLHYTTLASTTPHYIALHYLPLHFTTLHHTAHPTKLQLHLHNHTPVLDFSPHYMHYITLHYLHSSTFLHTTIHFIKQHQIAQNDTAPQIDRKIDKLTNRNVDS